MKSYALNLLIRISLVKKLALTSITLVLTACGGETVFNAPSEDMQACVAGTWSNTGRLPADSNAEIYSEVYTYFADGTFQRELLADVNYDLAIALWLSDTSEPFVNNAVQRTTGGWAVQDGKLYTRVNDFDWGFGNTEEDALADLPWSELDNASPIADLTYSNVDASSTHCDEEYLAKFAMKVVNETPLTYRSESQSKASTNTEFGELTLFNDGTGTLERSVDSLAGNEFYRFYNITYSYSGNVIDVEYSEEGSEEIKTREYTDYGPVIKDGTNHAIFVRQ